MREGVQGLCSWRAKGGTEMKKTPWFIERMASDDWHFGLLMITGHTLLIQNIVGVSKDESGNFWIDANLEIGEIGPHGVPGGKPITSPTSRTIVSINAAHIVAAFEMADT